MRTKLQPRCIASQYDKSSVFVQPFADGCTDETAPTSIPYWLLLLHTPTALSHPPLQVYSAALYVEADRCSKELGVRYRGGFFENDGDYCSALMDGAFNKALIVHLVRDVDGPQFASAINESLAPRMKLMGETAPLEQFVAFFNGKKLTNNTEVSASALQQQCS